MYKDSITCKQSVIISILMYLILGKMKFKYISSVSLLRKLDDCISKYSNSDFH